MGKVYTGFQTKTLPDEVAHTHKASPPPRALEFEFHLQFPHGSLSTELLDSHQSARSGKERREIKIHVYSKRQTANVSWEFLRMENKQIKTVQNDAYW